MASGWRFVAFEYGYVMTASHAVKGMEFSLSTWHPIVFLPMTNLDPFH